MKALSKYPHAAVKVYHGYGHTHNLIVYGHVFEATPIQRNNYTKNVLTNINHLLRLFLVRPLAGAKVQLHWGNQLLQGVTEADGFFKFEWQSDVEMEAGWHRVTVDFMDESDNILATGEGKMYIPYSTQYIFVSDIDDTVMVSHSATIGKRLGALFTNNPRTRKAFAEVVKHYGLLAHAHTTPDHPNPFFYVSSSEWNLYDDLIDFFNFNDLPQGIFLLNQIKRWYELLKTGKTKHEGKLLRVARILDAFPKQQFVMLGDNSQSDPSIYASIASKHPEKIYAVYIRNVVPANATATRELLAGIQEKGVHTCLFENNTEAIQHSKTIGLIA